MTRPHLPPAFSAIWRGGHSGSSRPSPAPQDGQKPRNSYISCPLLRPAQDGIIHGRNRMNKKNFTVIVCATTLGTLGSVALAQEPDDSVFETVTVTAQKREQSIYEVPVAISAFTAKTIERQGITDLTDIGKFVPNLNITGFSAGHTSSQNPFIRGIGLQDHLITTEP